MRTYNYTIVLTPEPEGGYTVTVPALPGCVTYGKTFEKATEHAKEAVECYLGSLIKRGKPIPSDAAEETPLVREIKVREPVAV